MKLTINLIYLFLFSSRTQLGPISIDSYQEDDDNAIIDVEEDYKTPIITNNRIGRPTKSSLSSPVSSTASDDDRLSPDVVQVRITKLVKKIIKIKPKIVHVSISRKDHKKDV